MKKSIFELMENWADDTVELKPDAEVSSERIKSRVLAETKIKKKRLHTAAAAILIAAMLSTVAFAAGKYSLKYKETDGFSSQWRIINSEGVSVSENKIDFPEAGLALEFECAQGEYYDPAFKLNYLPEKQGTWQISGDGVSTYNSYSDEWVKSFYDDIIRHKDVILKRPKADIPFRIDVCCIEGESFTGLISGKVDILYEKTEGDWYVIKFASDYSETSCKGKYGDMDIVNYIIAFDTERGILLSIGGISDMETLEKIAEGIELKCEKAERPERDTDSVYEFDFSCMDLGRG